MNYSKEQIEDVKIREGKALETLKELQLTPAAQITKVNVGNDVFADRVIPFLQDTKYTEKKEVVKENETATDTKVA